MICSGFGDLVIDLRWEIGDRFEFKTHRNSRFPWPPVPPPTRFSIYLLFVIKILSQLQLCDLVLLLQIPDIRLVLFSHPHVHRLQFRDPMLQLLDTFLQFLRLPNPRQNRIELLRVEINGSTRFRIPLSSVHTILLENSIYLVRATEV
uniref:Uncharacterized protein n=1 Tax=Spongospora subterranea TaxID=70186 RepID=A0A0H5QMU9_9EUKA|eukprot:CRZ02711.1 hypothetical protein [Spongospora subterranea]